MRPQDDKEGEAKLRPAAIAVGIKTTEPARFIFREHQGPYWKVGRVVSEVASHLSDAKLSRSILVRYSEDPGRAAQETLITHVGYVAEAPEAAAAPFALEPLPAETVAFAATDARAAKPLQILSAIRMWLPAHGYEALGPVNEIHLPAVRGGRGAMVEVQVSVRRAGAPAPAEPPAEPVATRPPPDEAEPAARPDESGKTEPVVPSPLPPAVDVTSGKTTQPPAAESTRPPAGNPEPAPSNPLSNQPLPTALPEPKTVELPKRIKKSGGATFRADVAAGRWSDAAAAFLPSDPPLGPAERAFAGAIITRLRALSDALLEQSDLAISPVDALLSALISRYADSAAPGSGSVPVVFRIDSRDPRAAAKKQVIADLDGLLSAVGLKAISIDRATERVVDILESAANVNAPSPG